MSRILAVLLNFAITLSAYARRSFRHLMVAEQEKAFRQNPFGAASEIVKRVFSAAK